MPFIDACEPCDTSDLACVLLMQVLVVLIAQEAVEQLLRSLRFDLASTAY